MMEEKLNMVVFEIFKIPMENRELDGWLESGEQKNVTSLESGKQFVNWMTLKCVVLEHFWLCIILSSVVIVGLIVNV